MTTWSSTMRPRRVLATASGCSDTSLRMNDDHPPFSAAEASHSISNGSTSTGSPSKSVTVTASAVISTIWSWPIATARLVNSTKAATSEPRKFSPSPSPMTSGELRRAPTTTPGSSRCTASRVNAPVEARHRVAERLAQVAGRPVLLAEQHGGDLGVGLGLEREALGQQLVLQVGEVLDDAVVDECEATLVAEVRVRIAVGGAAVRRPAGVADAGAAVVQRVRLEFIGEHLQLAGALRGLDGAVVVDDGHPRRVVATVFEAAQAAHEHVEAVALSDISDDSTHSRQL